MQRSWILAVAACAVLAIVGYAKFAPHTDGTARNAPHIGASAPLEQTRPNREGSSDGGGGDGSSSSSAGNERAAGAAGGATSPLGRHIPPRSADGAGALSGEADRVAGSGRAPGGGGASSGGSSLAAPDGSHPTPGSHDLPERSAANSVDPDATGEPPVVAYDGGPDKTFTTEAQTQVEDAGPITGGVGTVSFWLKPQWGHGNQDDATFVQLGDSGLEIVKNVNYLRFQYIDSSGMERGLGTTMVQWPDEQWRQVTATWNNGDLALYVNGKLVSQDHYDIPPDFQQETKLYVGSSYPSGAPVAQAELSLLKVLNRQTSAAEVAGEFKAGPPHQSN